MKAILLEEPKQFRQIEIDEAAPPVADHSQAFGIALVAEPVVECRVGLDDLSGVVGGAVINRYEAAVGEGLRQQGLKRLREPVSAVVERNADSNKR